MPNVVYEIWFADMFDASVAREEMHRHGIYDEENPLTYLKTLRTPERGFGFYDYETATLAKLIVADMIIECFDRGKNENSN